MIYAKGFVHNIYTNQYIKYIYYLIKLIVIYNDLNNKYGLKETLDYLKKGNIVFCNYLNIIIYIE